MFVKKKYVKLQKYTASNMLLKACIRVFIVLRVLVSSLAPVHPEIISAYQRIGAARGNNSADISPSLITITSHIESWMKDLKQNVLLEKKHEFRLGLLTIGEYIRFALCNDTALYISKKIFADLDEAFYHNIRAVLLAVSRVKVFKELGRLAVSYDNTQETLSQESLEDNLVDIDINEYLPGDISILHTSGFDANNIIELRIHNIYDAIAIYEVKASLVLCKKKHDIEKNDLESTHSNNHSNNLNTANDMNDSDTDTESIDSNGLLTPRHSENIKEPCKINNSSDYKRCFYSRGKDK